VEGKDEQNSKDQPYITTPSTTTSRHKLSGARDKIILSAFFVTSCDTLCTTLAFPEIFFMQIQE
jgi:hypothetical protein